MRPDETGQWVEVRADTEAGHLAELAEVSAAARHGEDPAAMIRRDHLIRHCRASWRTPYVALGEATGLSRARLAAIVAS